MLDCDIDGWVAIWIGSFPKKSDFNAYLKETYRDPDDDLTPISQFAVDLKETFYDHDFVFGEWHRGKPKSVETLLKPWRAADSFLEAAVAAAKKKKIADGNTVIIAYDHQYNSSRWPKDSPVRFLGNFPYDETPPAPQHAGHSDEVATVLFSPDGKYVVSGGDDGRVGVWSAKTGEIVVPPITAFKAKLDDVDFLAFSANGKRLVASIVNQTCIWDPFPEPPQTTKPTNFGTLLVSADGKYGFYCAYGKVLVFDLDAGKEEKNLSKKMPAENVRVLPNGNLVTVTPKKLLLWELAKTKQLAELKAPFEQRDLLEVSPQGKYVVTCGGNLAAIWDLAGRKLQAQVEFNSAVGEFVLPNEEEFSVRLGDKSIVVCSLKTGKATKTLEPTSSRYFRVQASAKGDLVGLKNGRQALVWNQKTGKLLGELPPGSTADDGAVRSFAFSPDGKRIALGHHDGRISIYAIAAGKFSLVSKGS
ncbi:immunity 22 family protein [Blastopirellula sp. JC732]|uniref:Immunity 22 family protein n=1 Tax=Blastopirellula sediminis TaxID=2894196 RepID=A0A9X1MM13_9BACT|nr:immunity 22 family protein [Blastopirellula sediminis]MCC9607583.1 immunity 22 family protein [Blastopirellula sediminis]MCC9629124.1 immunity 22 family protein [Blastopirellula sediminis]